MQPNRQLLSTIPHPDLYLRITQIEHEFSAAELDEESAYVDPEADEYVEALDGWEAASIVESMQRRAAW